jgi:alpha-ketoglutarate-dependent taurine dioxygenase
MTALAARELRPEFGSEVTGLEPRLPLDAATVSTLRELFDARGLLVFRDLDADIRFQTYLTELLIGNDIVDPTALPVNENFVISNREPAGAAPYGRLLYHSDQMWSAKDRVDAISLYGRDVAQPAVPTMFVSAQLAWETLPGHLREKAEHRFAVQHYDEDTYRKRAAGDLDVLVSTFKSDEAFAVTPLAFTHPRTGRTLLYICQQTTQRIVDMPEDESDALLDALFDHLYAPGTELAHHWRQGDLAIWDNLALQHARPNVAAKGPARTLRKTLAPLPKGIEKPKYSGVAGS